MWLQLQIKESKVMFGAIYRIGRSTVTNNKLLNETIQKVSRMYEKVIICGDFNFPEINWETFKVNAGPYSAPSQFLSCLKTTVTFPKMFQNSLESEGTTNQA